MRIIVVGGGIGGLTLALALGRRGLACVVLEQANRFAEVGAGVQLSPNAVRALESLGLGEAIRLRSSAPAFAEIRSQASGRRLLLTPLGEAAQARWGAPYLQIHRADLHDVLVQATRRTPGVSIRQGVGVIAAGAGGARLSDGEGVRGDLVVACDGVRSPVRAGAFGDRPRFTGEVAWRGLARSEDLPTGLIPPAAVVWTGPGRHVVHYPLRAGRLVNFIAVVRDHEFRIESWREDGRRETLLQRFEGWPPSVGALIRAAPSLSRWALVDRAPLKAWTAPGVVLLGDAAHPMLPFLAQGAAMAIEDAVVLAGCLARTTSGAAAAAVRYEGLRKPRTSKVQEWSRRNGRLFHLPDIAAQAAFGAAGALLSLRGPDGGARRLDWLYGYDAEAAVSEGPVLAQPLAEDYIVSQSPPPSGVGPPGRGVTS